MTIVYTYGNGLYVNLTNRCTNACEFCVRQQGSGIYGSDSLWLEREPTKEEALQAILEANLSQFSELVFCGYGEPTCRLHDLLWIAREVKARYDIPIRVNTNGHASLIYGENTGPWFAGAVDTVSISLNAPDAQSYVRICHPEFGEDAYEGMLTFARQVKDYVPHTAFSVVRGSMSDADLEQCIKMAQEMGIEIRIREMIEDSGISDGKLAKEKKK